MSDTGHWKTKRTESDANRVVHTDRDCPRLRTASGVFEAAESDVEDADVCRECSDENDRSAQDWGAYRALTEAASHD